MWICATAIALYQNLTVKHRKTNVLHLMLIYCPSSDQVTAPTSYLIVECGAPDPKRLQPISATISEKLHEVKKYIGQEICILNLVCTEKTLLVAGIYVSTLKQGIKINTVFRPSFHWHQSEKLMRDKCFNSETKSQGYLCFSKF